MNEETIKDAIPLYWFSRIKINTGFKYTENNPSGYYELDFNYSLDSDDNPWLYISELIRDKNAEGYYKKAATLTLNCWIDSLGNKHSYIRIHDPVP